MVERKQWAPVTKKASEAKIGRVLISFAPPSVYRAGSFRGSPYLSRPSRGAYGFARRATTATQQFEGSPDPRGGQVALEHAAADLRPGQTRVRCSPKSVKDSVCRRIAEDGGRRVHGRRCFRRHFWTRQGSRIESCRARSRGLTPHATRSSGVRQSVSCSLADHGRTAKSVGFGFFQLRTDRDAATSDCRAEKRLWGFDARWVAWHAKHAAIEQADRATARVIRRPKSHVHTPFISPSISG